MNPELYNPRTPYGRYRITKRYAMRQGRGLINGSMTLSWEDEREALSEWAQEHPESEAPEPQRFAHHGEVVLVEPGQGELRVAVLCPGPSLVATWPEGGRLEGFDLVIAVNNACEWAPHDWWSSQDHGPMKNYLGDPRIGICTSGSNADALTSDRAWRPKDMTDAKLDSLAILASHKLVHQDAPRRGGWSTVNAMILAARLGAKEIHLFGDDKVGNVYHDGRVNRGTKPGRWDRETKNQKTLEDALEGVGVSVVKHRPPQLPEAES